MKVNQIASGVLRVLLAFATAAVLAACGGGSGSGGVLPTPSPTPPTAAAPVITAQPQSVTAVDGTPVTFAVAAMGDAPLSYQWFRGGVAISTATAESYTVPAVGMSDTGATFTVVVTGPAGTVTSAGAVLTVAAAAPMVDVHPAGAAVVQGGRAHFDVHATGTQPLQYQWMRGAVAIPGATAQTLDIDPVTYGDDGTAYSVQVSNAAGTATSQAAVLAVSASSSVVPVSACREITSSGAYVIQADLVAAPGSGICLAVHDVQDVQIDCATRALADAPGSVDRAIDLRNVRNFSLKNCRIETFYMTVATSANGSLLHHTFTTPAGLPSTAVTVDHSSRITFDGNTITSGTYQQFYADTNTVSNNHITSATGSNGAAGTVVSNYGLHNRFLSNVLDGTWSGTVGSPDGADDGIVLTDESDVVVQGNEISNAWDCGVEVVGSLTDAIFHGNRMTRMGVCGFGGWYWLSVSGATFTSNRVEDSWYAFYFMRTYGMRPAGTDPDQRLAADVAAEFRDIVFDGNVLAAPRHAQPEGLNWAAYAPVGNWYQNSNIILSGLPGERVLTAADVRVGNVRLRNNDFGHIDDAPFLGQTPMAAGLVIDDGGNSCKMPAAAGFPLSCH
jgi:hypothetical protein